jgi:hypothetical protein
MLTFTWCESCAADEQEVPSTCYRHAAWLCDACAADLDLCLIAEQGIGQSANDDESLRQCTLAMGDVLREALSAYSEGMQQLIRIIHNIKTEGEHEKSH